MWIEKEEIVVLDQHRYAVRVLMSGRAVSREHALELIQQVHDLVEGEDGLGPL